MADKRVWFITGAGRGMGVDIAKAALAAGHAVVATGRNTEAVTDAVGEADDLVVVELDITSLASAERAVQAAVERLGRIDVLVNNAGNFYAGFFEELTPEQMERQLTTNLVGPMNVTRAVLPVMREQQSGHVVTITSTGGIVGQEFCSAYSASKFGLEGWMESLRFEVEPFGIHTTIVGAGLLPHRFARKGVNGLRRGVDCRLRRAHRADAARLGGDERQAGRRPREAREGPCDHRRRGAAAAALGCGRGRGRDRRAEGQRPACAGRRLPQPVFLARVRPGSSHVTLM
jgi:NAD(P)-dependent dehydrogenase (short-subunit alcohol dehydrogenase family)